jgi:hypothetical protein
VEPFAFQLPSALNVIHAHPSFFTVYQKLGDVARMKRFFAAEDAFALCSGI